VAGPARAGSDDAEVVKGGTGFAARTLLRWIEAGAPSDPVPVVVD
jgi:leucyl aminopeptidase